MRCYRQAQHATAGVGELSVVQRFAKLWDAAAYKARRHTVAGLRRDALLIR
jgi:hypothetical protein